MTRRAGIALDKTYLKRAFQLSVELNVKDNAYGTVKYNGVFIYNWAKEKFVDLHLPDYIGNFSSARSGQEVNIIYNIKEPYFCIKASHPDEQVAGRFWAIEAEIILCGEKVLLGVKLSYTTPVSQNAENVDFSVPNFVKQIYRKKGMKDVWQLQSTAHQIGEEDLKKLKDLINDDERTLPVVVITERASTDQIGNQYNSGFLLDGDRLAAEIGMISHIVCLNIESTPAWNNLTGKDWGVYNGAVRTYFPGACFSDTETYVRHPLSISNRILAASYEDPSGMEHIAGDAFHYILMDKIKNYNTSVRLGWETLGHKFYYVANQEILLEKQKGAKEAIEMNVEYDKELDVKEQEIKSCKQEIDDLLDEIIEKDQKISELKSQILALNDRLNEAYNKGEIDIPILDKYEELPEWIAKYFPGRLVLPNKAKASLKFAQYEDVPLVYEALKLLGTTYWKMKAGYETGRDKFEAQCAELGIADGGAISDTAAGERGETYYVDYGGKRCFMERHLKKGDSREPRYCMRIYYFWDDVESVVVIASLPQHLETKSS